MQPTNMYSITHGVNEFEISIPQSSNGCEHNKALMNVNKHLHHATTNLAD